ncbi:MAG TPA: nuclear transport factor 2 family protein [Sphingomonadaceae bacterium]
MTKGATFLVAATLALSTLAAAGCASAQTAPPPSPTQTEAQRRAWAPDDTSPKAVVDKFDQMAFFDGDPVGAIKKYLSDDFIERYPDFAKDGFPNDKAAMLDFFEKRGWKKGEANKDTIYQVLADGDRVAVFHHVTMRPDDRGIAFVDIFRVKDGLIVEHWAVGQPVSDKVSPLHSMF